MNEAYTQQLLADFPRLHRGHHKDATQSCMCWGFSCGDGWFDLIHRLSADIEQAAHAMGIDRESEDWPRAVQVKEKFDTLRYYIETPRKLEMGDAPAPAGFIEFRPVSGIDQIRELIHEAEKKSASICEDCGAPDELVCDDWWRPICPACDTIRQSKKARSETSGDNNKGETGTVGA